MHGNMNVKFVSGC